MNPKKQNWMKVRLKRKEKKRRKFVFDLFSVLNLVFLQLDESENVPLIGKLLWFGGK